MTSPDDAGTTPEVEETLEFEVPDTPEELLPPEVQYHTLLQVWTELLAPAREKGGMRDQPVNPQWATKIVTSYPEVTFADTPEVNRRVYELVDQLGGVLDDIISTDSQCLTRTEPELDATENKPLYKQLLTDWQVLMLHAEMGWSPTQDNAAAELAALAEVHNMFFGQQGLTGHLESIRFEFTEEDQAELRAALEEAKDGALSG